jgi:hypothetical protein
MIPEGFFDFMFGLAGFLVGLFPSGGAPAWLTDGAGYLSQLFEKASGLGAWINFGLAGTVMAAVLACVALGLGIKVVRMVVSVFTGGGGGAA